MTTARLTEAVVGVCAAWLMGSPSAGTPTLYQSPTPVATQLQANTPFDTDNGSEVVKFAQTAPFPRGQVFRAAVFPQIEDVTNDQNDTVAEFIVGNASTFSNRIALEHGVVVCEPTGWALEPTPPGGGGGGGVALVPRPYPITTITSIGAGAEGSIIIVGVTTGVIPPLVGGTMDVVVLFLDGDEKSMLYTMQPDDPQAANPDYFITRTLDIASQDESFLSVRLTPDGGGGYTASAPVQLNLADHAEVAELQKIMRDKYRVYGDKFWEPGK